MLPYERFDAWKMAHQLALKVYALTEHWPTPERYGLTAQLRRAALSVPTNIAEGTAKRGPRELRRFSRDRGLLTDPDFQTLDNLRDQAGKLTWRFYASLNKAGIS
jgi:hypothetical protein